MWMFTGGRNLGGCFDSQSASGVSRFCREPQHHDPPPPSLFGYLSHDSHAVAATASQPQFCFSWKAGPRGRFTVHKHIRHGLEEACGDNSTSPAALCILLQVRDWQSGEAATIPIWALLTTLYHKPASELHETGISVAATLFRKNSGAQTRFYGPLTLD